MARMRAVWRMLTGRVKTMRYSAQLTLAPAECAAAVEQDRAVPLELAVAFDNLDFAQPQDGEEGADGVRRAFSGVDFGKACDEVAAGFVSFGKVPALFRADASCEGVKG